MRSTRVVCSKVSLRTPSGGKARIRCITLDVTGTVLNIEDPVEKVYCEVAAHSFKGDNSALQAPQVDTMKTVFKQVFKEVTRDYPAFGHEAELVDKDWWRLVVERSFEKCWELETGKKWLTCEHREDKAALRESFDRCFTRIYQHYGTNGAYRLFDDVKPFLQFAKDRGLCLGVVTNNSHRVIDSTLPLLGVSGMFDFFLCSRDVGVDKPEAGIFHEAVRRGSAHVRNGGAPLANHEVLHIGDNVRADYRGARGSGLHSILLRRNEHAPPFSADESDGFVVSSLTEEIPHLETEP
ncbi:putative uncharacterized hydrolase C7D4.05 [Diplonema papillatum]|nr:putative uncharacterized hydrolase C7D4.05 [Diplonema papillatum]